MLVSVVLALWSLSSGAPTAETAGRQSGAPEQSPGDCVDCHAGYERLFDQAMATRTTEKLFVEETVGGKDPYFYEKNCQSCHVQSCLDCHRGKEGKHASRPETGRCLECHKGYYVGWDFKGMAPREDSLRYQRGETVQGETFLKMLPDVHAEAGMGCADCHSMRSLVSGKKTARTCADCHLPDQTVVEHGIRAHLDNLECYACHSAWAAQEYGTFYLRLEDSSIKEYFRLRPWGANEYLKSAYLKKQDSPPLGLNSDGKVSPIRPQFIVYFTHIKQNQPLGEENRLLATQWRSFFPHTVRRGTVMCDGCHGNARRFLLEKEEDRIHRLREDGLFLDSFWDQTGQTVVNGSFMPRARFSKMSCRGPAYKKAYVRKWKNFIQGVEDSSGL